MYLLFHVTENGKPWSETLQNKLLSFFSRVTMILADLLYSLISVL